jgi:hypothetical protein
MGTDLESQCWYNVLGRNRQSIENYFSVACVCTEQYGVLIGGFHVNRARTLNGEHGGILIPGHLTANGEITQNVKLNFSS